MFTTSRNNGSGWTTIAQLANYRNIHGSYQPTVTLTRPTPGNQFLAPATVELEAAASDVDGAIRKVEFFAGATLLGELGGAVPAVVDGRRDRTRG